ncbi:hypothetical protein [Legionella spiritensis]|uniref:Avidin family protein n=2 Tax=Legionella spiritensis TaxID=452 RepID=A0A0W0Z955_LEGSP|nr:hypothetical protein [Legionella spiritensis]KTD65661.1 hypothetical protein Lspi_0373 [Legionella spiritensis]SNV43682.1 Uncharacterised protein [Legionella spiritensis]VEG90680.1 Uncharacterised protein [Legionella spiritensis]
MKGVIALSLGLILGPVYADNWVKPCGVHTWHEVISQSGQWHVSLKMINQNGRFVDQSCSEVSQAAFGTEQSFAYGFGFARDADFDIAYTLTAVQDNQAGFQSKACVFVVTANGPAQPDIQVVSYHGAECHWSAVKGVGENFTVG